MAAEQPPKKKGKTAMQTLDNWVKKRTIRPQETSNEQHVPPTQNPHSPLSVNKESIPIPSSEIERDPGKRKNIRDYPLGKRDEIRRAFLMAGPYQPKLQEYEARTYNNKSRHFQYSWFNKFSWLEYSPSTHKAYCFPCYLFCNDINQSSLSALVTTGFDNWKRVQGKDCAFIQHVGSSFSLHNRCLTKSRDLMKPTHHIDKVMYRASTEEIKKNRLRLKTTIVTVRWLALQGCSFRGHDESEDSLNRGNVIKLINTFGEMYVDIKNVLDNAPKNAKHSSWLIQKEILEIMANKVRRMILEEIGDAFYSILIDEAQDESHREKMAIILRFVNNAGILTERFFAIRAVSETSSGTLKKEISNVLVQYNLHVHKLRGQGYDGASNMRGHWNGLQAQFLKDCPYAYFVHCFAHRLQLTLVAAAKQCDPIWDFFSLLDNVINIVRSYAKRYTQLQDIQRTKIENMLTTGERESGRGANQITTLRPSGSTRWGSHYESIRSMMEMYDATCKAFQKESVDILAAMGYVSNAKTLLQELRDHGWDKLLQEVKEFCARHEINIPNLDDDIGRGHRQITLQHHYHFDIFNEAIDFQLRELDSRFNESSVRLLSLSVALDPKNSFQSFNYELAVQFYPEDFEPQERNILKSELKYYCVDVVRDPRFEVPTLAKLCEKLVEMGKSRDYKMITRLIHLVLTLPISTATTERAFSAMKHVKTTIRSKMGDDFFADRMTIFVERELVNKITIDSIIDDFASVKDRRSQFC